MFVSKLEKKILGDGNCLFRYFSYFLYNDDNLHHYIRMNVVNHVFKNCEYFGRFVLNDPNNPEILDKNSYKFYMSQNGIYGGEVELISFSQIYPILIVIYTDNFPPIYYSRDLNTQFELNLHLSSFIDKGHYNVLLNSKNNNFLIYYKKIKSKEYYMNKKNNMNVIQRKKINGLIKSIDLIRLEKKRNKDRKSSMSVKRLQNKRNYIVFFTCLIKLINARISSFQSLFQFRSGTAVLISRKMHSNR
ncbi:hypothetical protein TSAR_007975 [Trichomalopsis sarcophagae]|uniref:OTU domain-containing protein n=1 Tax=Trichomalopsis sarcophagae TaxID=543379 RepID=A0A232FN73_9HYME|nr:hypothetical protein TSAR_007975 [Trichomalopsis sarcophagae]